MDNSNLHLCNTILDLNDSLIETPYIRSKGQGGFINAELIMRLIEQYHTVSLSNPDDSGHTLIAVLALAVGRAGGNEMRTEEDLLASL